MKIERRWKYNIACLRERIVLSAAQGNPRGDLGFRRAARSFGNFFATMKANEKTFFLRKIASTRLRRSRKDNYNIFC